MAEKTYYKTENDPKSEFTKYILEVYQTYIESTNYFTRVFFNVGPLKESLVASNIASG